MIEPRFLLVDKPAGWTSHDVVARVRKASGIKKVGHAGTLDPMATGLLVIGLGRATRLLRFIQDLPKVYEADVLFGVATDSLDADGVEIERRPMDVTRSEVEEVMAQFVGDLMQVPPMVSALKQGGRRLHELAREGVEVVRPPRPVTVHEFRLIGFEEGRYPRATVSVTCGKGTYVRSLADDVAKRLGGRAHLTKLRRTAIGSLSIDRAVTVPQLEAGEWTESVLRPAAALGDLPAVELDDDAEVAAAHGRRLSRPSGLGEGPVVLRSATGRVVAVYRAEGDHLLCEVGLS